MRFNRLLFRHKLRITLAHQMTQMVLIKN
uniref:Uncharacterized protein n=1 Tax=Musa acuminata subsp. malaccensis TaxID=214687 RepID=A0A804HUH0_MUSAM